MKVGILITARLKSTRLPFKILRSFGHQTVIEHLIDRAKKVKGVDAIVLCTSSNPQDRPLIDIAINKSIYYYLGSEEDVLLRLKDAAKFFNIDKIISVTADNPLFSIYHSNLLVDKFKTENIDFFKFLNMPIGTYPYGLNTKAIETVCEYKQEVDTEIWGTLLDRPEIFDVKYFEEKSKFVPSDVRLTLDYEEDFELLNIIFSELYPEGIFDLSNIFNFLRENPELKKINGEIIQNKLPEEVKERIENFYSENKNKILEIKEKIYGKER